MVYNGVVVEVFSGSVFLAVMGFLFTPRTLVTFFFLNSLAGASSAPSTLFIILAIVADIAELVNNGSKNNYVCNESKD